MDQWYKVTVCSDEEGERLMNQFEDRWRKAGSHKDIEAWQGKSDFYTYYFSPNTVAMDKKLLEELNGTFCEKPNLKNLYCRHPRRLCDRKFKLTTEERHNFEKDWNRWVEENCLSVNHPAHGNLTPKPGWSFDSHYDVDDSFFNEYPCWRCKLII